MIKYDWKWGGNGKKWPGKGAGFRVELGAGENFPRKHRDEFIGDNERDISKVIKGAQFT